MRMNISKLTRCMYPQIMKKRLIHNGWSQAMEQAERVVSVPIKEVINPKDLVGKHLDTLTSSIKDLLASGHPTITKISNYYFESEGKHIRPLLILLMSQACSPLSSSVSLEDIDMPISNILKQGNSREKDDFNCYLSIKKEEEADFILPSQKRLAEISEMIHTASLFHDDVVDDSLMRRGVKSVNAKHGNKMAIFGGNFLLARSSVALARLKHPEVIELLATVIANLVEGELLQIKALDLNTNFDSIMESYIEKSYLKTASLIAKSCKASALLSNCSDEVAMIAYNYGKNLGIAFQLIDDMLDFVTSAEEFGKPVGADLELGLCTAPVLFAWQEYPELAQLIKRKFSEEGDVQRVRELVFQSQGLIRTKQLALKYCDLAISHINHLPPTPAREALIHLCEKSIHRKK